MLVSKNKVQYMYMDTETGYVTDTNNDRDTDTDAGMDTDIGTTLPWIRIRTQTWTTYINGQLTKNTVIALKVLGFNNSRNLNFKR